MAAELEYDVINEVLDLEPQFIGHYHSKHSIDETQFNGIKDPLVIFRDRGTQIQVKVTPLQTDVNPEIAALSFKDKIDYFQRKISNLESGEKQEDIAADLTVAAVKRKDIRLGNYNDFLNAYALSQADAVLPDLEDWFDSMYIDLKDSTLSDFSTALEASLI